MILGTTAIRDRLEKGQIFRPDTWDSRNVKEASYQLRVARDGLLLNGTPYPPGSSRPSEHIDVDPGEMVVLSTMEQFNLPEDIVGRLGLTLNYTVRGLTPLFGFQVDPGYSANFDDERLYLRVVNLGPETVRVMPGTDLFNIEFHEVSGDVVVGKRERTFKRILDHLPPGAGDTYASTVRRDVEREVDRLERGFQPVVLFGVFLVASAVIGAVVAILVSVLTNDSAEAPSWFQTWGWVLLASLAGVAFAVTALVGVATIFASGRVMRRHPSGPGERQRDSSRRP